MRIKRITVKNLFGVFDHEVPMKMQDRITIIHGPNGYGKTILLTMLRDLFSSSYSNFYGIPFSELSLGFDDKSNLRLKKHIVGKSAERNTENGRHELTVEFTKYRSKTPKSYTVKRRVAKREALGFPLGLIEEEVPHLDRVGPETWIYLPTQERLSLEEVLNRFGERLPVRLIPEKLDEPDWFKEIKNMINIRFIETQRLLSYPKTRRHRGYEGFSPLVPAVTNYSEELANTIQAKLAEYATLSQSFDRSFPLRLVKVSSSSELTIEELRTNLNQLEEKRSRLMAAGLLDKEKEIDIKELQRIDEGNRNVLSVYIEDVKSKLSVLDELTNKIDLLVKIINSRFLHKQMSISKKEGFTFKTSEGKDLLPIKLSSGEQHELVLLYELLFKVKPDSLILIDEPELSLHVLWQQQFLKDLEEITKIVGLDFLIATHSPQIIHDRWDLTVELKGPSK